MYNTIVMKRNRKYIYLGLINLGLSSKVCKFFLHLFPQLSAV